MKRRAEAVENLRQGLQDLKSRNEERVLTSFRALVYQVPNIAACSSVGGHFSLSSSCSDIMARSMGKSLTILLLPISFGVGCGIFCLRVYIWVSYAHIRGLGIYFSIIVVVVVVFFCSK